MLDTTLRGFPAHAGIDLKHPWWNWETRRLPRARGDRPDLGGPYAAPDRASPRTRGSTWCYADNVNGITGFPAHAGIDPIYQDVCSIIFGLPRARGDRPQTVLSAGFFYEASPRTRGSTLERLGDI